jgi:DNA-binding CsgD family transcriptional regulator
MTMRLSDREAQVIDGMSRGLGYKEIASLLGVSHHTIKTHAGRIRAKLEVRNTAEAVAKWTEMRLSPSEPSGEPSGPEGDRLDPTPYLGQKATPVGKARAMSIVFLEPTDPLPPNANQGIERITVGSDGVIAIEGWYDRGAPWFAQTTLSKPQRQLIAEILGDA